MVGVKRWTAPVSASTGVESGNSSPFRNDSARSPITTTSLGCTMCSSRSSHGAASFSLCPATFRQFVP
jgi:hypothetical protein